MRAAKKKRLEAKGWRFGDASDFLGLSPEEAAFIDVKLRLAHGLRRRRLRQKCTQNQLATKIHSSQSRIAKMEAGDPSVSLDLMFRSLFALGASRKDVARIIASVYEKRAPR